MKFSTWLAALTAKTSPADADLLVLIDSADSNAPKKITKANLIASASVTVKEADNSPSVAASTLIFPNGTLTDNGGGSVTYTPAATSAPAYILLEDQKAQNTNGGTFTSGAWRDRDLNTEVTDSGNNCTLSSNTITLAAGTYDFYIRCPAQKVAAHQARLYNVSDSALVALGTSEPANTDVGNFHTYSVIKGRVVLAAQKDLKVQHYATYTCNTTGFGMASNIGTEIYTIAEFIKVA